MPYQFKPGAEAIWFLLVTLITTAVQFFQGAPPTDWGVWALSLAAALVRTLIGAALHLMSGSNPA